jgi:putative ABC transport system permease protein
MIILMETGLIGVMGALLGIGVGTLLGYIWVRISLKYIIGWILTFSFPAQAVLFALALALLVSLAAGYYPARRASRINIIQAISYE